MSVISNTDGHIPCEHYAYGEFGEVDEDAAEEEPRRLHVAPPHEHVEAREAAVVQREPAAKQAVQVLL